MKFPLEDIKSFSKSLDYLIRHCENLERDVAFYTRVLKQEVLTHGELEVNPTLAAEAQALWQRLSLLEMAVMTLAPMVEIVKSGGSVGLMA